MIQDLVPHSILNNQTRAYDSTWADRLLRLKIEHLLIDIENETNPIKLEYWLEMFGIDTSIFDFSTLDEAQRKKLILRWLEIIIHCGSEYSIQLMAYVLGADYCRIWYNYNLTYDGSANYNGLQIYDAGSMYSRFSINVDVGYVYPYNQNGSIMDKADFDWKFRKLFQAIQPIRIHLNSLNYLV